MTMARTLATVGYQGRSIDDFVALLGQKGVERIVDVREVPLSRKRGFSKTALRAALEAAGIEYVHVRAAGNPLRREIPDVAACLRAYEVHLRKSPDVVDEVLAAASGARSALLCFEGDPACCHRSVIARAAARSAGVVVENL